MKTYAASFSRAAALVLAAAVVLALFFSRHGAWGNHGNRVPEHLHHSEGMVHGLPWKAPRAMHVHNRSRGFHHAPDAFSPR